MVVTDDVLVQDVKSVVKMTMLYACEQQVLKAFVDPSIESDKVKSRNNMQKVRDMARNFEIPIDSMHPSIFKEYKRALVRL